MARTRRWIDPRTSVPWVVSVRSVPRARGRGDDPDDEVIVVFASVDGLWTIRERLARPLDELPDDALRDILDRAVEAGEWRERGLDLDLRPGDPA